MATMTATNTPESTAPNTLNDHNLVSSSLREEITEGVLYEKRPVKDSDGKPVPGLSNAWIILDNQKQYNSYTTEMVKGVILALREASNARDVVTVIFTGAGDRAFCTGGNTKEYAEYYAGNAQEYRQYIGIFNEMVTNLLTCNKPVICRVNGMRIGGGQEIGMACDFSIAQDLARIGQAGPKHGSAPIGGATDFLPPMIGVEQSMVSAVLCEPFSAHKACRLGILADVAPALKVDGKFVPNPLVITDRMVDEYGRIVHGESKTGEELAAGKKLLAEGTVDLSLLDDAVETLATKLLYTFPECTLKTIEELRKPKLARWHENKESHRAWLALNMMTEARAGFRAFNEGTKESREIDFIALRQAQAVGVPWSDELTESLMPAARAGK